MTTTQRTDEYLSKGYDIGSAISAAVTDQDHGRDASAWHDVTDSSGSIHIERL